MTGIAWLICREAIGIRRLRQARRLWEPAAEAEQAALSCPKNIPLYFDERQSPGTVGLIRPAIVLPKYFAAGRPTAEKVLIVRHELAYARRRDPLVSFIARFLRALFWISPALWLLERRIDAEREAAADRAAIGFSPHEPEFETSAVNYADTLLAVAKELHFSGQRRRASPLIGIGTGSALEIRIRRLLSASRTTGRHIAGACAVATLSGVMILIVPGAGFSEQSGIPPSELTAATANQKNLPPNEERIESPAINPPDEATPSTARAGDGETPNQARAVKTKPGEDAARSLTNPAEMVNGKTAEISQSKEPPPARPLPDFENTPQSGQTIYGPARKSAPEMISPQIPSDSDAEDYYQPARQKREGEDLSKPSSNRLPATAPR